ncbi:hypothetical protein [Amycolatopsis sp. NBC_00438]|uniref:hypothetical protein n=1 Tax=Amycolatopsis sp. NBC_00438 TaxID=2903558 RepID=UPI002E239925
MFEQEVARLDAVLEPIANAPYDGEPFEVVLPPGAREVLRALLDHYATGGDDARAAVRALFERYPSFRWAVSLPDADFRTRLLHFSACDQGADPRDELLALNALCAAALADGVDVRPVLREVAALSSPVDKYGMGSTRDFLLRRAD